MLRMLGGGSSTGRALGGGVCGSAGALYMLRGSWDFRLLVVVVAVLLVVVECYIRVLRGSSWGL